MSIIYLFIYSLILSVLIPFILLLISSKSMRIMSLSTLQYRSVFKMLIITTNLVMLLLFVVLWFNHNRFSVLNLEIWVFNPKITFNFYLDNLSFFFILLTVFLTTLVIYLDLSKYTQRPFEYYIYLLILQFLIINFFLANNLLFIYIFFESVLIPMFLIITIWGSRKRKIHASLMFFFFTFVGSLFMLLGISWLLINFNTLDLAFLKNNIKISEEDQKFLWLLFFIAFAVKVPIFPLHTWLPEAHVEAPTGGSIMLAGILLKLGLYGILRILMPLFPYGSLFYSPVVLTISFISVIYISLIILQEVDLKKIVAYSSIAHMNLAIIGIFVFNEYGLQGAVFTMLSHGLISSLLFFCIGILYERYSERSLLYYSNLVQIMPQFSVVFFFALVANMGVPGTSSFVGEFLLLLSFLCKSIFLTFILALSFFLTTVYCIWLYNRITFGSSKNKILVKYKDITKKEWSIALILIILIIFFGIYPNSILNIITNVCVKEIQENIYFDGSGDLLESLKQILSKDGCILPKDEWSAEDKKKLKELQKTHKDFKPTVIMLLDTLHDNLTSNLENVRENVKANIIADVEKASREDCIKVIKKGQAMLNVVQDVSVEEISQYRDALNQSTKLLIAENSKNITKTDINNILISSKETRNSLNKQIYEGLKYVLNELIEEKEYIIKYHMLEFDENFIKVKNALKGQSIKNIMSVRSELFGEKYEPFDLVKEVASDNDINASDNDIDDIERTRREIEMTVNFFKGNSKS